MTELVCAYTCDTPAPPEKTFAALTQAEHLTSWFAANAEIELKPGGAFRFWGSNVFGAPNGDQAGASIVSVEPGRSLVFRWPVAGRDSQVELTVEPKQEFSQVAVRQIFQSAPEMVRAQQMFEDLWRMHFGNLASYLRDGAPAHMPDFTDPHPAIRSSIVIDAPRASVFRALIDPEMLKTWMWASNPVVEPRAGGAYSYGWAYKVDDRDVAGGPTRILEYVENERLVTDWPDWRGDPAVPVQKVTWLLEEEGPARTRVTVIHDGFTRAADVSDYPYGWRGFLEQLRAIVTGG